MENNKKYRLQRMAAGVLAVFQVSSVGFLTGCSEDKKEETSIVIEQEIDTNNEVVSIEVEPTIEIEPVIVEISIEEMVNDVKEHKEYLNSLGLINISDKAIYAAYFLGNIDYFTEDTIHKLIEHNLISTDQKTNLLNSLEYTATVADNALKSLWNGATTPVVEVSKLCKEPQDIELLEYAYERIKFMQTCSMEEGQKEFDSYMAYLTEDIVGGKTNYPWGYNESSKGGNFLLNISYGPVYSYAGVKFECGNIVTEDKNGNIIEIAKSQYLEDYTLMRDVSDVLMVVEHCDAFDKENEITYTK